MVIRINKKEFIHTALIYFLIILNQSCLYNYFLSGEMASYTLFGITLLLIFLKYKNSYNKYLIISGTLLATTIVTRIIAGGIGLQAWISHCLLILFCVYVITYDIENFLTRFVKVVVFLAGIGIILFAIQITMPEILKQILFINYDTEFSTKIWSDSSNYVEYFDSGYGLFLYSFRDNGDALMRSKGIFTESGICQMVYNSAIFILLFMKDKINIIKYKKYLLILIVAIITVQSTTGYIDLGVMLIVYVLIRQNDQKTLKSRVIVFAFIGLLCLFIDFAIRDSESFIYTSIISKLFSEVGSFEVQASGQYRLGAISLSILSMIQNPLGIGADKFSSLMSADTSAGGGAGVLKYGAINGVIALLICLYLYFVPVFKYKFKWQFKLLLCFIFINTLLAQTGPFYSVLIMFPIYFIESNYGKSKKTNNIDRSINDGV